MKRKRQEPMKSFLRVQMTRVVNDKRLTADKAAEIFKNDSRSYEYLKSGKTMCETMTLIIF